MPIFFIQCNIHQMCTVHSYKRKWKSTQPANKQNKVWSFNGSEVCLTNKRFSEMFGKTLIIVTIILNFVA